MYIKLLDESEQKMKLAIMQPYLFPYIGYWQLINAADKFVVLDDVSYIKKGWINRNRILLNGKDHLFTLPLKNVSQNRMINEIELEDSSRWKSKFLKTLEAAYKKAPGFNSTVALVEDCLDTKISNLSKFITNSIKKISLFLDIKTKIVDTSSDYNSALLKKDEKIISICSLESASEYINPIGGIELYQRELFQQNGIDIKFLKTCEINYQQMGNTFIPNLSIIDVIMFNRKEKIKQYLLQFNLI